jgi:hypoxanthine phosphoribosyltransferase
VPFVFGVTVNDLSEILRVRKNADCLACAQEVEQALTHLACEITLRLENANPLVLVIMNGGLILAGQLLPKLDFPLEMAYVHATRYGDALGGGQLEWRVHPSQDLQGRHVLLVDDILDEGHTLAAMLKRVMEEGAQSVSSAVLVHKLHDRKASLGMRADFTGLDLPDRFLFGCGMDYKGYWRNLPEIWALNEDKSVC